MRSRSLFARIFWDLIRLKRHVEAVTEQTQRPPAKPTHRNPATLEVRHRLWPRCEDRIRALKDTGLRHLPFHGYAHNQLWLEIVALAADLLTWSQTLAFHEHEPARRGEPKRLRFRILAIAGRIIRTSRRRRLRLPRGGRAAVRRPFDPCLAAVFLQAGLDTTDPGI